MSAKDARELKTQGVLEAADDPNSKVTADDAQKAIVEQSKNAGVAAFSFDPDATPEQKRAQAQAVSLSKPPKEARSPPSIHRSTFITDRS